MMTVFIEYEMSFVVDSLSGVYAKVFIELGTFVAQVNKTPLSEGIIHPGGHSFKLLDLKYLFSSGCCFLGRTAAQVLVFVQYYTFL